MADPLIENNEEVPTEVGDEAGQWASLQADPRRVGLSNKELQDLHRLTQRHLFWGRQAMLAGTFATILIILIGTGLLIALNSMSVADAKDLFPILLPPLFTLLGAAGTMYFNAGDRR